MMSDVSTPQTEQEPAPASGRLRALVPARLLGELHARAAARPASIELRGAVLFADISRYSTWVESVVQRGRDALDQVPRALELTFGAWTDAVYASGGEVVQMAGDSLLAVWIGTGTELDALRQADACAQQMCQRREPSGEEFEVGVHIGVGVGAIWVAAVGGSGGYWNLVVGGDAVREAALAHSLAGRGQHRLSHKAEAALAIDVPRPAAALVVPRLGAPSGWLAGFLPREHSAWFESEEPVASERRMEFQTTEPAGSWSELRTISAVFVNVRALDEGSPDALQKHHELFCRLQSVVYHYEGPSAQLLVDDKGLVFTAVFGVPGCFHHDDPERALRTAVEINDAVRSMGYRCSVGVATGDACFRSVGTPDRRYLTVVGTPMNRAARLMALHKEGVVCDAATEKANRMVVVFEPGESLRAPGLSSPVQSYRPVGRQTASRLLRPLVGREHELLVLQQALAAVREGRTNLVVVRGEAGIGKSRLMTEFLREVPAGVEPAFSRAERSDRVKSLLPWYRIVCQRLAVSEHDDPTSVLGVLSDALSEFPELQLRLPLLDVMLGVDIAQTEVTRHLASASRADAMVRLVVQIVRELTPQPRLLVFEDGQWLDSASWRVLEWALSQIPALLVVLCVRAEEEPEEVQALVEHLKKRSRAADASEVPDAVILSLGELSGPSVRALIAQALSDAPPSAELVAQIGQGARGNPFYVEEMTRALLDEGVIAIRNGEWRAVSASMQFSELDAVERLLVERVDRLPRAEQAALRLASVFGRGVERESLSALVSEFATEEGLDRGLAHLCARCFLRAVDHGRLEFAHDHIRDAVYGTIPAHTRAQLHGLVGRYLEARRRRADWPTLVTHFQAAGAIDKAVKYADLAGQDALNTGAFKEAHEFFSVCLRSDRTEFDPQRPTALQALRWRRQVAEACEGRGDVRVQAQAIEDALDYCGHSQPRTAAAAALRAVFTLFLTFLNMLWTRMSLGGAGAARDIQLELARCYSQAGAVYYFKHRAEHCVWASCCALRHAVKAGPSAEQVVALAHVSAALGLVGFRSLGEALSRQAHQTAELVGDPSVHARAVVVEALYRIGLGQWEQVEVDLDKCQQLAEQAGDALNWCNAQVLRYWVHHYLGDWAQAEHAADVLMARAQNSGNLQQELWALRCKALSALFTDRPKEAREHLRLSLSALSESADLSEHLASKGTLALCLARLGNHSESIALARETLDLLSQVKRPTVHSSLDATSAVAEVLLRGREAGLHAGYPRWSEWEQQALGHLRAHQKMFCTGEPRYLLWLGLHRRLSGHDAKAHELWACGLSKARALRLKRDVALLEAEIRRYRDHIE